MKKARINTVVQRLFSNWPAKVIALVISLFIFFFYRLSTQREIPIPLDVTLPSGYEIANERPESIRIIMRGSKAPDNLTRDNFSASVDLSSFTDGGTVQGKVSVEKLGDANKLGSLEFEAQPAEITFILEQVLEKYVPVDTRETITGQVSRGYVLERISMTPENVLLRGPKSHVEKITGVTTENFDISGKIGAIAGTVRILTNDRFVRAINVGELKISLVIAEKREKRVFDSVMIGFINLDESLAPADPPRGQIEVEAAQLFLEGLSAADLKLVVDCGAVTVPGEYLLAISSIEAPKEAVVMSYEPKTLQLHFEKKP